MIASPDEIEIRRLSVSTHIGVPDEERATPQTLWISLKMHPFRSFSELGDDVTNTVDYYQVSLQVAEIAAMKPRRLIETLAIDIADFLLTHYPLKSVGIEVEKEILPNTDFVAVRVLRTQAQ